MMIYCNGGIRVLQHEYLTLFYVQKWMEGDNPRSYGRHWDYYTVLCTNSIKEVNDTVKEMLS